MVFLGKIPLMLLRYVSEIKDGVSSCAGNNISLHLGVIKADYHNIIYVFGVQVSSEGSVPANDGKSNSS